jgi:alpha-glucosidase
MSLSLFGIANTMVDGCGSLGSMDLELCSRWMQLASFMPMFRSYFNETFMDTAAGTRNRTDPLEPNTFKSDDGWSIAFLSSISNRLPFMRYIYSQLYYVYRYGGAMVKPHFYDFPEDDNAFNDPDHTYMLGDSIKVSPILKQGLKEGD